MNPPRVLHVVESLDRGAVENWLMRMLRHAHSRGVKLNWTFYCTLPRQGALDDEAAALGAGVLHSPVAVGNKASFIRALRAEMRRGRYDVMHCHHDLVSAMYLVAAIGLPMHRRLVHVHNADEVVPTPSRFKQFFYREPLRRACLAMTDGIIGISDHTLDTFLDGRPRRTERDIVHYYGIEAPSIRGECVDRAAFRRSLGFSEDSRILLFAGRMVPEKNPQFALDVLAEMIHLDPKVAGVFVGSGSLDAPLAARAAELGLQSKFRALGWRNDVQAIMRCCDWFILPRPEQPMEGFGIAVVEAQLAGLRLLLSRGIADDPILAGALFCRLALSAGARTWALAATELMRMRAPTPAQAEVSLRKSRMDMDYALTDLMRIYQ